MPAVPAPDGVRAPGWPGLADWPRGPAGSRGHPPSSDPHAARAGGTSPRRSRATSRERPRRRHPRPAGAIAGPLASRRTPPAVRSITGRSAPGRRSPCPRRHPAPTPWPLHGQVARDVPRALFGPAGRPRSRPSEAESGAIGPSHATNRAHEGHDIGGRHGGQREDPPRGGPAYRPSRWAPKCRVFGAFSRAGRRASAPDPGPSRPEAIPPPVRADGPVSLRDVDLHRGGDLVDDGRPGHP
jgi:hypothetical protein